MLRCRKILTRLGKEEIETFPSKGCPQGGVLSPLLWCLVIDSLLEKLEELGYIKVQAFADDISHWYMWKNRIRTSSRRLEWCKYQSLSLSAEKTTVVKFTKNKRQDEKTRIIRMNNVQISYSNHFKYLGVILDTKLTFKAYLEHKLLKQALWTCKSFVGNRWGISPKMKSSLLKLN